MTTQGNETEEDEEYTQETLTNAKKSLRDEWTAKRDAYIYIWNAMTPEEREDVVRAVNPQTPNSPTERFLLVEGRLTDVHMNCIMAPQLCISELVPDNKFIDMMESRCTEDDLHWIYQDHTFIKSRIEQKLIAGNVTTLENQVAFLFPLEKFGTCVNLSAASKAKGEEWFEKGIVTNATTFSYLFNYQSMMYSFLNSMLKKLIPDAATKESNKEEEKPGCSKCGLTHWVDDTTRALKFCTCGKVMYCSKECQKVDWPTHKPDHTNPKS